MANKNKLESRELKILSPRNHLDTIKEISVRNEYPVGKVREIYLGFYYKLLSGFKKGNKSLLNYSSELEERVFSLTERYLDIERVRELKSMMSEK